MPVDRFLVREKLIAIEPDVERRAVGLTIGVDVTVVGRSLNRQRDNGGGDAQYEPARTSLKRPDHGQYCIITYGWLGVISGARLASSTQNVLRAWCVFRQM
jgi:hypothetical protein